MAGLYPDPPGHRFAYDRDGTVTWHAPSNNISVFSQAQCQNLNDELMGASWVFQVPHPGNAGWWFGQVFPELRDLRGVIGFHTGGDNKWWNNLQTSINTTNGLDGTWSTLLAGNVSYNQVMKPNYRSSIYTNSANGIRGWRWMTPGTGLNTTQSIYGVHVYGFIPTASNPNRLRVWHPTLDQEYGAAHFDWGDVPRNSILLKQFRIKNESASLTANSVAVTREALSDTTPSNVSQHLFSLDNLTYTTSLNLGTLDPGEISPIIYVQRSTPGNAAIGLWDIRGIASAASWT